MNYLGNYIFLAEAKYLLMKGCPFIFLFFLLACKQNTVPPAMPESYIKFMVDGQEFKYSGGCDSLLNDHEGACTSKGTALSIGDPIRCYTIMGSNPAKDEMIYLQLLTDSLVTSSFTPTSGLIEAFLSIHNEMHATVFNHPGFIVNVTRNTNGTIEGNFSGTLYWPVNFTTVFDSVVITNGEFKNVQIIY